jgi:hypothetical protein
VAFDTKWALPGGACDGIETLDHYTYTNRKKPDNRKNNLKEEKEFTNVNRKGY